MRSPAMRHLRAWLAAACLAAALPAAHAAADTRTLRVCSDPDNMPFSNDRQEGFEDKIAAVLADDLHATLQTTFRSARRGFVRRTLQTGDCDVVMGILSHAPGVATTRPYYRSSYVFVTARDRHLRFASFDDEALRDLRIGLHALGAEGANTPPAEAFAKRGVTGNIVGFPMFGTDGETAIPPGRIIDAVAQGQIDVAIVWGPIAGYSARQYPQKLDLEATPADPAQPLVPFAYDIALGVRKDQIGLRDELDGALEHRRADILAILNAYGVPLTD